MNKTVRSLQLRRFWLTATLITLITVSVWLARILMPSVRAQDACLPQSFEPSGGQFNVNDSLNGVQWEVNEFLLQASGDVIYGEEGLLIDSSGELLITSLGECVLNSIAVSIRVLDWTTEPSIQLAAADIADVLQPEETGPYLLFLSDPLLSEASLAGEPVILTVENSIVIVEEIIVNQPGLSAVGAAIRILLVTQDNRVAEYRVDILPGVARGHANQFNQWLVTVLDEQRRPLDVYGIWDPRLLLLHEVNGNHSELLLTSQDTQETEDVNLTYLFDIVLPFSDNYNGGLPREVLLYDQVLQLIADIDLTDAINEYCDTDEGQQDATCLSIAPLEPIDSVSGDLYGAPLYGAPFGGRPEATTNPTTTPTPDPDIVLAALGDSEAVAGCLPLDSSFTSPQLLELLASCNLLTWEVNE